MRNLGIEGIKAPAKECTDRHCPFHSQISLRGRTFTATIKKVNLHNTAVIEWERPYYLPKYERYEKRRSKISVHKPACMDTAVGDVVTVMETKPISKTKSFVIIEVSK